MNKFFKILNVILIALILFLVGFLVGKKYDFTYDENNDIVRLQYSKNEKKGTKVWRFEVRTKPYTLVPFFSFTILQKK